MRGEVQAVPPRRVKLVFADTVDLYLASLGVICIQKSQLSVIQSPSDLDGGSINSDKVVSLTPVGPLPQLGIQPLHSGLSYQVHASRNDLDQTIQVLGGSRDQLLGANWDLIRKNLRPILTVVSMQQSFATGIDSVNATLSSLYVDSLQCPNDVMISFHKLGEFDTCENDRRDLRYCARMYDFRRARADWRVDWLTRKNALWADRFYKSLNLCAPNAPFGTKDLFQ